MNILKLALLSRPGAYETEDGNVVVPDGGEFSEPTMVELRVPGDGSVVKVRELPPEDVPTVVTENDRVYRMREAKWLIEDFVKWLVHEDYDLGHYHDQEEFFKPVLDDDSVIAKYLEDRSW